LICVGTAAAAIFPGNKTAAGIIFVELQIGLVAVHGADVPGMVETLSIAVIGAPGVGKTSIIRQFIYNDFSEVYTPTRTRYVYRPSVILNGNMYDLKILDVPPISSFPSSSSQVR
jgi:GTPase SAR1 family protein